jgi:hypothetical protein
LEKAAITIEANIYRVTKLHKFFALTLLCVLFAVIIGEKFMLIDRYGSDLPFWDQWDAEGDYLYCPYLEGHLTARDLVSGHNEHRIFFTRILALGLFEANDHQWDCRVQMLVNTILHAAAALLLVAFSIRVLPLGLAIGFTTMTAVFFSSSISWENTLCGFQSQFYFLLLFSILHLGGTLLTGPRTLYWWLAPLAGLAAQFSMASGLLSAAAILCSTTLRIVRDRKLTSDDLWILSANFGLCIVGWLLRVEVSYHDSLKAAGFASWLDAWAHQLAWPIKIIWLAPLGLISPLLLGWSYLRRHIDGPQPIVLMAASAWLLLQTAAIAYARGAVEHGYASRYADLLSVGVLLNLLILLYIVTRTPAISYGRFIFIFAGIFTATVLTGLTCEKIKADRESLYHLPDINAARIASVRTYLSSHDPSFFAKTPWSELPYPSASRLAELLDRPVLREILPTSVRPPLSLAANQSNSHDWAEYPQNGRFGSTPHAWAAWLLTSSHIGTFSQQTFSSETFSIVRRQVSLYAASAATTNTTQIALIDEKGRSHVPLEAALQIGPKWKRINFAVSPGSYRLEVTNAGPDSFAFTQPTTDTLFSILALKIARFGPWLLGLGAGLAAAAFLVFVAAFRTNRLGKFRFL